MNFIFFNNKKVDSALILFNKAYEITAKDFPNHYILGNIQYNIANIHFKKENHLKALQLFESSFNFYKVTPNTINNVIDVPV